MPNHPSPPLYIDTHDRDEKYQDSYNYYKSIFPKERLIDSRKFPNLEVYEPPSRGGGGGGGEGFKRTLREVMGGEGGGKGGGEGRKERREGVLGRIKEGLGMVEGEGKRGKGKRGRGNRKMGEQEMNKMEEVMEKEGKFNVQLLGGGEGAGVEVNYNNLRTVKKIAEVKEVAGGKKGKGLEYVTQGEGVTVDGYMGHLLSPRFLFFISFFCFCFCFCFCFFLTPFYFF